jgi:molybdopterin/thiamine biosynthesis adenylyltransferase
MRTYLRQRGLVDQESLMDKRILISGSADGIADLFVILSQLGAGSSDQGQIGIIGLDKKPTSVFWNLMLSEIQKTKLVVFSNISDVVFKEWDIHLTLEGSSDLVGDLNGSVNGLRGIISNSIQMKEFDNSSHPIHPSMRTIVASTMIHHSLKMMGVCRTIPVSDVWLTVTCRIETTDMHLAREHVRGIGGVLLDVTKTHDGLATLARYRLPYEHGFDTYSLLELDNTNLGNIDDIDVGFIPWNEPMNQQENNVDVSEAEVSVLGVGGLGSWAAPLICQALPRGVIHIIDGDDEIALHNLNRQVLYHESDVGKPKAEIAMNRLSEIFSHLDFRSYQTFLTRTHLAPPAEDGVDFEDLFEESSQDKNIDSKLRSALKSSDICLGCLDNMQARTILNEAALNSRMPMINGGGESIHGLVERFHTEGCMICRYGKDAANAPEVVSCTEEGARPITSIVTTTAWVGAMMAALTILELSNSNLHESMRYTWLDGDLEKSLVSKPPWFDEDCIRHFLQ